MKGIIYLSAWLLTGISLFAQITQDFCSEGKISYYGNLYKTTDIDYPGDATINVTYYKLDLFITHSPQYLEGKVTVRALSQEPNLQNFYLDLEDTLTVDSVKSGNQNLFYFLG